MDGDDRDRTPRTRSGEDARPKSDPSPLTTDALLREIAQLDRLLTTRIDLLSKSLDERYDSQSMALAEAAVAADKAVRAALDAQEKAVAKAEAANEKRSDAAALAAEKRFDALNGTRTQLADQAATFLPRSEAGIALKALGDKLDESISRDTERFAEHARRLDLAQGNNTGMAEQRVAAQGQRDDHRGVNNQVIAAVVAFMVALSLGVSIAALFTGR